MSTVPRRAPLGTYRPTSHRSVSPSRVPGQSPFEVVGAATYDASTDELEPAPVPDLLGALASVLGVDVEDLPTGGPDQLADEPDVDPFAEPTWLE